MKYSFNLSITCKTKVGEGKLLDFLCWKNLTFELMCKYQWYFKYREALLRVKYPKSYIDVQQWKEEINEQSEQKLIEYQKKKQVTLLKTKIKKLSNAIQKYEEAERQKLIQDFDNKEYIKAKDKLAQLRTEFEKIK